MLLLMDLRRQSRATVESFCLLGYLAQASSVVMHNTMIDIAWNIGTYFHILLILFVSPLSILDTVNVRRVRLGHFGVTVFCIHAG